MTDHNSTFDAIVIKGAFTHTSYNDYEIVADNLFDDAGRKWTDRIAAYALFIDPLLGRVGDEVVHSLLDVIYAGLPYTVVQHGIRVHPTVSELIPTLLGELQPLE